MNPLDVVKAVAFGGHPAVPNLIRANGGDDLPSAGLTMGSLYLGRQGVGKTSSLARHLVDYAAAYPTHPLFLLDWSGGLSDAFLTLALAQPEPLREKLLHRIVYDELGHPEWVLPLPELSTAYGGSVEEEASRVSENHSKLAPALSANTPYLGGLSFAEIGPHLCLLLSAIQDAQGGSWQLTEGKKLLTDEALLRAACTQWGGRVPQAKWFFEKAYLKWSSHERDLRTYALLGMLGAMEAKPIRARLGYPHPAWTPQGALAQGEIIIVDGARLINQARAQHYLFTQAYSLIMAAIQRRRPNDPEAVPVSLIMDEVYSLIGIPGMAAEVGKLAPLYRSRKLQPYLVIQALSQLEEPLREQIWSVGNVVCFALADVAEAQEVAQQLFGYEPQAVKLAARRAGAYPLLESDRGQSLALANWLQRLRHRECLLRRFLSEEQLDLKVRHVPRTRECAGLGQVSRVALAEAKELLLRRHGVEVSAALEQINRRQRVPGDSARPQV